MKKLLCVLAVLGSMSAKASELESGKYEQTVEGAMGQFNCEYKVINAKDEGSLYLTMSNCAPDLLNLKLETQDGVNFTGKRPDAGIFDLKVDVELVSNQAFKIKFSDQNRETGAIRNVRGGIAGKKVSCK
jgi:hypothetical protein